MVIYCKETVGSSKFGWNKYRFRWQEVEGAAEKKDISGEILIHTAGQNKYNIILHFVTSAGNKASVSLHLTRVLCIIIYFNSNIVSRRLVSAE